MIHVAVLEDEEIWEQAITELLERYRREEGVPMEVDVYRNAYDLTEKTGKVYDVLLLDIEMAHMTGMEAARQIRERDESVAIIFVTANPRYAIEGYQVQASDYILKPVQYPALRASLKRSLRGVSDRETRYVTISERSGARRVEVSKLRYIESRGHRLTFHLEKETLETTTSSMKEMEELLSGEGFFRISSGCLVNLRFVDSVEGESVRAGEELLPLSRRKRTGFLSALTDYLVR